MEELSLHLFSGAGNSFIIVDGREGYCRRKEIADIQKVSYITDICERYHTDGLMVLEDCEGYDFRMVYYNPDGSGGMMCGNGGRCISAFADGLGVRHEGTKYRFLAADGPHEAEVLSVEGGVKTIRLKMTDVNGIEKHEKLSVSVPSEGYYLNTGTRHYVRMVPDAECVDVESEGKAIRWCKEFAPGGVNVNYVSSHIENGKTVLKVRTFEKGVERETLACGTGIVASAIAAWQHGIEPSVPGCRINYRVKARGGELAVDFIPAGPAVSVYLTGPAEELQISSL